MFPKVYFFLTICIVQKINSQTLLGLDMNDLLGLDSELGLNFVPDCMSVSQSVKAVQTLCKHKNNATLWQEVIDCHVPISEKFMRESGEAQCAIDRTVKDPTDKDFSIQEVFFNICGFFEGSVLNRARGLSCLFYGEKKRNILSHYGSVETVKRTWGKQVLCNIGKCVLRMNLDLGL